VDGKFLYVDGSETHEHKVDRS